MWCNFLLIQNLPYGITSEDLVRALIGTFPDGKCKNIILIRLSDLFKLKVVITILEFEMPFIQQTLHATVFNGVNKRGHNTVRAVVGGLVVEYDDLVRKAAMRQINGRFWVFKQVKICFGIYCLSILVKLSLDTLILVFTILEIRISATLVCQTGISKIRLIPGDVGSGDTWTENCCTRSR